MNLKNKADIRAFMQAIKGCGGNVFFESPEDKIDLKSVLSQYVFCSIMNNKKLMDSGSIRCENTEDYGKLEQFME